MSDSEKNSESGSGFTNVVALSGGVGGARLLHGLLHALPAGALTAVVNTGDDFVHLGLHISPDVDTVMYTLTDLADEERGWGLAGETFRSLEMVRRLGGDGWFMLGDRDLATHILRTQALLRGRTLSEITADHCRALGLSARVLPMADGPCRTIIETDEHGPLSFQDWFVRHRAAPEVKSVRSDGNPPPAPGVLKAISEAELVVFGPSNPYVSLDPILQLAGVREAIARRPVIALSPIVAGQAVKGPLARMIPRLDGEPASPAAVARHYGGLVRGMVVERGDEAGLDLPHWATETVMRGVADRTRLAADVLAFARTLIS